MSSKPEQSLILEPPTELRFKGTQSTDAIAITYDLSLLLSGPFKEVVVADLKLTNPTTRRACYKVKTTSPKKFCAQPNIGTLDPHQTETISGTSKIIVLIPIGLASSSMACQETLELYRV